MCKAQRAHQLRAATAFKSIDNAKSLAARSRSCFFRRASASLRDVFFGFF
jgi:hypothetical protein